MGLIYCACNCGEQLEEFDSRGRKRIFILGHHVRGRVWTEESRKCLSESRSGIPLSEEHKRSLSLAKTGIKGDEHNSWTGGKHVSNKRVFIYAPDHLGGKNGIYIQESILVAEKVLGKYLPNGTIIHHIDGNPSNNESKNLVICEDKKYHNILHRRKRAYEACGHANWLKCGYCHSYDDLNNLKTYPNHMGFFHSLCKNKYDRKWHKERKTSNAV